MAKFTTLLLLPFLPLTSVEIDKKVVELPPYRRYDFHAMLSKSKSKSQNTTPKTTATNIKNLLLIALYGNEKFGFIVVATKAAPKKTKIVSVSQSYKGYTLSKIYLDYVVFKKDGKEYLLRLNTKNIASSNFVTPLSQKKGDGEVSVNRDDIGFYMKNPLAIWKDISIQELKEAGKLSGFKVTRIRKNSKIANLGLQRGDIIIGANGRIFETYNDVMKIYAKIKKLKTLSLTVKRGNEEKEIIYEIN
jgi:general secretion pathway protein C